ncbi:hypothetical protein GOV07_01165 [Candidatus Woesearchaeota archaeon]|nr:hypothetical protein [Candidatus Woesearchaeota archaeon]
MTQGPNPILKHRGDAPQVQAPHNLRVITRDDIGLIASEWWDDNKREAARTALLAQLDEGEFLDGLVAFYKDSGGYRIFVLNDIGQQSSMRLASLETATRELQHVFQVYLKSKGVPTQITTEPGQQGTSYTLKSDGYRNDPVIATTADLAETVREAVRTIDYL